MVFLGLLVAKLSPSADGSSGHINSTLPYYIAVPPKGSAPLRLKTAALTNGDQYRLSNVIFFPRHLYSYLNKSRGTGIILHAHNDFYGVQRCAWAYVQYVHVFSVCVHVHVFVFPPFTASHKVLLNTSTSVPGGETFS